jgi:hypothetical protein
MNLGVKLLRQRLIWPAAAGAGMVAYAMTTTEVAMAQESPPAASSPADPTAAPVPSAAKPRSKSNAQMEAGEPRADTSPANSQAAGSAPPAAPSASTPPSSTPSPGAPANANTSAPSPSRTTARAAASTAAPKPPGQKGPATVDRLELNTATVTGEREQPKVMYIVPWKKSDIGDLSGKPMNSLLDEALAPVDRDEFKREVVYYGAVRADASQNGASKAAKQGEK